MPSCSNSGDTTCISTSRSDAACTSVRWANHSVVGRGSGRAPGGPRPGGRAASCFLTARALEQIKADVAYTNANVKLVGQSPGVGYGELGPTHHSIEDMAWLRLLPNLAIIAPSDPWETAQAVEAAAEHEGPVFLRITRFGVPKLPRPDNARFEIGKAETLREGRDVAIIACGVMVTRALEAADRLADGGVNAQVVNMASIAPLDEAAIRAAADLGAIVTVEEHSRRGGLGGAVAEVVAGYRPCPIRILGFPGFMPTGSPKFLFERFGLTSNGIEKAAREAISLRLL